MISEIVSFVSFVFGFLSLSSYLLPFIIRCFYPDQNLKLVYNAEWALVTGGSTGIGLEIVKRLADQGINVVVCALDDEALVNANQNLSKLYPNIEFRTVPVDLSTSNCLDILIQHTLDLNINLVFNNAGYIKPGLFSTLSVKDLKANFDTNAACMIPITHHYLNLMLDRKQKGLIAFTSSSGGFIPGPMSSMYSSTKAWMTNFAAAVAAEVHESGIDVMVVHPSPIASNFFDNLNMKALKVAVKAAQHPKVIADVIWKNAGRTCVVDQGFVSVMIRLLLKVIDWNLLTEIMIVMLKGNEDYKIFKSKLKSE
ncbi:hypothetical protein BC833DRAFT_624925 [Globomyces pollinis-pini]|nr:hypothetical protein BC833DRAFT_624925 [Globomyces pollinis-pini]